MVLPLAADISRARFASDTMVGLEIEPLLDSAAAVHSRGGTRQTAAGRAWRCKAARRRRALRDGCHTRAWPPAPGLFAVSDDVRRAAPRRTTGRGRGGLCAAGTGSFLWAIREVIDNAHSSRLTFSSPCSFQPRLEHHHAATPQTRPHSRFALPLQAPSTDTPPLPLGDTQDNASDSPRHA